MANGNNMLIFVDAANTSYMNMAANFRGVSHTADDVLEIYFESATGADAYDKIIVSIANEKENEVMKALAGALQGNRLPYLVVMDDVAQTYAIDNLGTSGAVITSITVAAKGHTSVVETVTANDALTAADSGKTFVFGDAAAVLTLPDSGAGTLIGWTAKFVSNFTATGQEVKNTDTTNEIMVGALLNSDTDDDNSTKAWNAEIADGFSSVEFTGVAEGAIGSFFTLTCIAADRWLVEGIVIQEAGSEATPFAAS